MSTYRPSVESPIPRDTYVLETDGAPKGTLVRALLGYAGKRHSPFDLITETVKIAKNDVTSNASSIPNFVAKILKKCLLDSLTTSRCMCE